MKSKNVIKRCSWPADDDLMIHYHDEEWGVPLHDDAKLFEFIVLDSFQAGLSWKTILHKRENFRKAFDQFNAHTIAGYGSTKVEQLLNNSGIIRNRLKIEATIKNARAFLKIQQEYGTFDSYIWQFTGNKTLQTNRKSLQDIPATSAESDAMSKDLKKRGFSFVGSTICYAFMQAAGMVNDHTKDCFLYTVYHK